jgi:hypothetical protein
VFSDLADVFAGAGNKLSATTGRAAIDATVTLLAAVMTVASGERDNSRLNRADRSCMSRSSASFPGPQP